MYRELWNILALMLVLTSGTAALLPIYGAITLSAFPKEGGHAQPSEPSHLGAPSSRLVSATTPSPRIESSGGIKIAPAPARDEQGGSGPRPLVWRLLGSLVPASAEAAGPPAPPADDAKAEEALRAPIPGFMKIENDRGQIIYRLAPDPGRTPAQDQFLLNEVYRKDPKARQIVADQRKLIEGIPGVTLVWNENANEWYAAVDVAKRSREQIQILIRLGFDPGLPAMLNK